jgi:hypothetical protein
LFVADTPPQRWVHAVPSSTQHVPFASHTADALAHAPVLPQVTVCWQLFCAVPHCLLPHAVDGGSGMHPQAFEVHVSPPSQPPQSTLFPQLSVV